MAQSIYELLISVVGTSLPQASEVCQHLAIIATIFILIVPFVVVYKVIQLICGR